ncbi:hypothetical protein KFE80_03770 [bacterium SCSIO 12696]|nr:hypothetical protein KFE80_03770 [bacterium SCSIO 12696]
MSRLLKRVVHRFYPLSNFMFYMQRMFMEPRARENIRKVFAKRLPSPESQLEVCTKDIERLKHDGFLNLGRLFTDQQVKEITEYLSREKVYDRWDVEGGLFDASSPPEKCHTALYQSKSVVSCPHILDAANDPKVLSLVESYLGVKPTISNLAVWWSYAGHSEAQEAEFFHRDVDDLKFIKLFVYLTDVDSGSGPHVFVKGSHSSNKCKVIRRYTDEEIVSHFGKENIVEFSGEAGDSFLEDTFGMHKGTLCESRDRLLFQVQYSLHPIGIYKYSPVGLPKEDVIGIDSYVNRLYVMGE